MEILVANNGTRIYPIDTDDKIIEIFLNKYTAYYGQTGSGKSYVASLVLSALAKIIPKFLCYSATEDVNGAYEKVAPASCVFNTFEVPTLKSNLAYQEKFVGNWKQTNDITILSSMFDKFAPTEDVESFNSHKRKLDKLAQDNDSKKKVEIALIKLYKSYLLKYSSVEDEFKSWMFVNPLLCIILDDFAAPLETAYRSKKNGDQEFMRSLNFNGRHYLTSFQVMLQNIDAIEAKARRNVHNNIFTSMQEARAYFKNSTNAFPPEEQRNLSSVAMKLEDMGGHRVLVHARDSTHKFYYMIGEDILPKLCCGPLRELDSHIVKKNTKTEATFEAI